MEDAIPLTEAAASEGAMVELGYAVAEGRWDEETVNAWLRRYSQPIIEEVA